MKIRKNHFFWILLFCFNVCLSQTLTDVPRGMRLVAPVHYSYGCAVSPDGTVYFSEFNRQQIRQVGSNGGVNVRRMGLSGVFGMAFDKSGNLFVGRDLGDVGNPSKITRITPSGTETDIVTGITRPRGIATDTIGNVYFATESPPRIRKWNKSSGIVETLVDNLQYPAEGVAVADDGTVYFSLYGAPESGIEGQVKKRATDGTISTLVDSGIWRSRGIVIDSTNENLYLCTEADQEDHGNSGLLVKIKIADSTKTNVLEGIDYPQFPSIDSDDNIYFSQTRDSWLSKFDPNSTTSVNDWSQNSNVKIGISGGQWNLGGSSDKLKIKVGDTLTFSGSISSNQMGGSVHGWIRIPESFFPNLQKHELYEPCLTAENPTPGVYELPKVTFTSETGSCLISAVVVRQQTGQRWPMQNIGTCNESPASGFSEDPTAYLVYFKWEDTDRVDNILSPLYTDSSYTFTIIKGSEPGWIYSGSSWNSSGQSWAGEGKQVSVADTSSWAELDLGAFSGKSKYIYVMWHKNGPYRPDAAKYRVYDYTQDKLIDTINQQNHADNLDHGNDTFSGWRLLGNKKVDITPSTKIRMSQIGSVTSTEFLQSDAVLLSDFPIVDNTSLGSSTDFGSNPTLSVTSTGASGIGSHWSMQGIGYQYTSTDSKSFAAKLDPNVFADLKEEDYYVEVSWDFIDSDNQNVTNATYKVNGLSTNDTINQNKSSDNQNGSFIQGNSVGTWSGFYRLSGDYTHSSSNPLLANGFYNGQQYNGKRFTYDMIRFVPVSESNLTSNNLKVNVNSFNSVLEDEITNDQKTKLSFTLYPNPHRYETTFSYNLPNSGNVSLEIYDISGIRLAQLINDIQEKGEYKLHHTFNNLRPGIYFCLLRLNGDSVSKKLIIR